MSCKLDLFGHHRLHPHADDAQLVGDDSYDPAKVGEEEGHQPEVTGGGERGEGHLPEGGDGARHEVHRGVHGGPGVSAQGEGDHKHRQAHLWGGEEEGEEGKEGRDNLP